MKHTTKLAVLLALSVAAFGGTARAAEYTETISGSGDNYASSIKKKDDGNGNYTYDFGENSRIAVEGRSSYVYGIGVENSQSAQANSICINPSYTLDLLVNQTDNAAYGIFISYNTADGAYVDRRGGGNIEVHNTKGNATGVTIENGGENKWVNIGDAEIIADARGGALNFGSVAATGLQAEGTANQIAMGNGKISTTAIYDGDISGMVEANGILAYDTSSVRTGNVEINVQSEGNDYTYLIVANGITTNYGAAEVETGRGTIHVQAINNDNINGEAIANGIYAYGGVVTKQEGDVQSLAKGVGTLQAYGLSASKNGTINLGITDVAVKTEGNGSDSSATAIGIYAYYGGQVNMAGGTISASADNENATVYALRSYGKGDRVLINQGTTNDVVINGDVWSGNEAKVLLNLNTANSKLNGSILDDNSGAVSDTGVDLTLANGAVWNNGAGFNKDIASNVTSLSMDGGVVHQQSAEKMTIQNYSGSGDILFRADDTAPNGVLTFSNTGDVVIGQAAEGSSVGVSVSNDTINTLDIAKTEENLNALAEKLMYEAKDDNLTGRVTLKEGLITPEASGDLNFYNTTDERNTHGYVTNVTRGPQETATMSAMKHIAAVSVLAWRQEDSTFSQRLGDLRRSAGGQGLWARMSRGEFKYDGEYKNQYDFYQLGYDRASGAWHYGAAFSYNDGETSYRAGYGENSSASLSLYGTWLGEKGHYADIVLKGGKLSNEYTITTAAGRTHGDYDLWGVSLSGEYGREIALADGWFVTPQAQMTLLHIGSEDYTTSNGIRVSQESLDSAVGRVGLEAGKRFGAGRVYGKFSLLHDFAGSADTWLRYEGLENSYREDIGDTWCEAGFGVNLRLTDSTYVYADVARTFGGDVETPWQWNAGVRWGF